MPLCKMCFNKIEEFGFTFLLNKNNVICDECYKQFELKFISFKVEGISCLAIYNYDEVIKKNLFQLKGCFDIELKGIFLSRIMPELKLRYRDYFLIPIPSSIEDDEEREFNHVEVIFEGIGKGMLPLLYKKYKMKQSELSKKDREKISQVLMIKNGELIKGKKILIVDDVYTTGNTFKASLNLIKKYGPKNVKALFLSKNEPKI